MMHRYLILLLLLLPVRSLAQHATIAATKMNVLYIGVDNPMSFAVENTPCSELRMIVENGSATKTGDCSYDVQVTHPGYTTLLLLRGKDTLFKTQYRAKIIPNPVIDGLREPYCSLDSLRTIHKLEAVREYLFDGKGFSVVSFKTTIMRPRELGGNRKAYCNKCFGKISNGYRQVIFSAQNQGGNFSTPLNHFIQNKLKAGDRVFFEDIRALGPDEHIRLLSPVIFTVW